MCVGMVAPGWLHSSVSHHQDVAVALEDGARKGLGQHVGDVMVRRHEVDGDEVIVDPLADGLDAHIHVLDLAVGLERIE